MLDRPPGSRLVSRKEVVMKTIVLGYDESEEAARAVQRTATLARATGATVVVTSVAPVMQFMARGTGPYDPADPPARHHELAADAAAMLTEQGVAATAVTGLGDAGDVIVELAEDRDADLVVLGMSHHPRLAALLGGVNEDVVRHARCDVLLVR
jgi:nucleotide-binding universal stress UspA family protein